MFLRSISRICGVFMIFIIPMAGHCDVRGAFDMDRWETVLEDVRTRALASGISMDVTRSALRSPAFIPSIVKSDRNHWNALR